MAFDAQREQIMSGFERKETPQEVAEVDRCGYGVSAFA
jgi:hypothetical protein